MSGPEVAIPAEALLGEGPTWDPDAQRLVWVDILSARVHTYDPATGATSALETGQHVGAAKPRAGGRGLVVNLRDGIGLYDSAAAFRWLHHEPVAGRRGNDAAIAPDGALWAGTMRYDETPGGGTLTRFAADGSSATVLADVTVSNGTGWSPDGRAMYYVDTPTRRIDVFDVADDLSVSGRRPLAVVEEGAGFPDGLCVDADGCVWIALWSGGAVRRYTPDGRLDRTVALPVSHPTACAFAGPALSDLYVTTARVDQEWPPAEAGSVFVVPDAGVGLAQPAFAG